MRNFFRDISDLLTTPAEAFLIKARLYRLARLLLEWHYADPQFRPWAKELGLAEICEGTGRLKEAEDHYKRVIRPGNESGYLFLGDFYERHGRVEEAIRAFETALPMAAEQAVLSAQLEYRLRDLRTPRQTAAAPGTQDASQGQD